MSTRGVVPTTALAAGSRKPEQCDCSDRRGCGRECSKGASPGLDGCVMLRRAGFMVCSALCGRRGMNGGVRKPLANAEHPALFGARARGILINVFFLANRVHHSRTMRLRRRTMAACHASLRNILDTPASGVRRYPEIALAQEGADDLCRRRARSRCCRADSSSWRRRVDGRTHALHGEWW